MKLRNKKTGEIAVIRETIHLTKENDICCGMGSYNSLAELNEEWEDYKESKEYWFIDPMVCGVYYTKIKKDEDLYDFNKQIGNYFETEEEAERAVEKLKAITRLSKCGFGFEGYTDRDRANGGDIEIYAHVDIPNNNLLEEAQPDMLKDLDLLFGGEDE